MRAICFRDQPATAAVAVVETKCRAARHPHGNRLLSALSRCRDTVSNSNSHQRTNSDLYISPVFLLEIPINY